MKPPRHLRLWLACLAPGAALGAEPVFRPSSARIAAEIRAGLPNYQPPAPAPAPAADPTEDIVLLPKVVVTGSKPLILRDWDLLTRKGQAEFLRKQFPGFVVPGNNPLTQSTPNYADQRRRDDVRLENLHQLEDTAKLYLLTGDTEANRRLKEEVQRALIRSYDWRTERLDRSYNNDRR